MDLDGGATDEMLVPGIDDLNIPVLVHLYDDLVAANIWMLERGWSDIRIHLELAILQVHHSTTQSDVVEEGAAERWEEERCGCQPSVHG